MISLSLFSLSLFSFRVLNPPLLVLKCSFSFSLSRACPAVPRIVSNCFKLIRVLNAVAAFDSKEIERTVLAKVLIVTFCAGSSRCASFVCAKVAISPFSLSLAVSFFVCAPTHLDNADCSGAAAATAFQVRTDHFFQSQRFQTIFSVFSSSVPLRSFISLSVVSVNQAQTKASRKKIPRKVSPVSCSEHAMFSRAFVPTGARENERQVYSAGGTFPRTLPRSFHFDCREIENCSRGATPSTCTRPLDVGPAARSARAAWPIIEKRQSKWKETGKGRQTERRAGRGRDPHCTVFCSADCCFGQRKLRHSESG